MHTNTQALPAKRSPKRWRRIARNWDLYLLLVPVVAYFILFQYAPMYGVQIAFKDYYASKGILGSPWVGFSHFQRFFNSYYFTRLLRNTLGISLYSLAVGFPAPILLALMINEVKSLPFKRVVQMVTYAPHFLSLMVVVGLINMLFASQTGLINILRNRMGLDTIYFLTDAKYFKTLYVFSGVWQEVGWGSIIYIAAISGIDPQLYEASTIDGAGKLQQIRHITLPSITGTIVILLILRVGSIMSVGFEKVLLLQNGVNQETSDVISTYVYRIGLQGAQFSFSSAVGLFNSVINFILLALVNTIAKRLGGGGLW